MQEDICSHQLFGALISLVECGGREGWPCARSSVVAGSVLSIPSISAHSWLSGQRTCSASRRCGLPWDLLPRARCRPAVNGVLGVPITALGVRIVCIHRRIAVEIASHQAAMSAFRQGMCYMCPALHWLLLPGAERPGPVHLERQGSSSVCRNRAGPYIGILRL